jgi:hypothetical protein
MSRRAAPNPKVSLSAAEFPLAWRQAPGRVGRSRQAPRATALRALTARLERPVVAKHQWEIEKQKAPSLTVV